MKLIWEYINNKDYTPDKKYKAALLLTAAIFALIGLIVWLIVRIWALQGIEWLFCFTGYPAFMAIPTVFIYSGRHRFS